MNTATLIILAYIAAQIAIGAWISRRIRTEADYLLAGRSLGYGLATFTIFATWFGAETCLGAAGSIYAEGLSGGTADPFGYAVCLLLMGLVFAIPLWRLGLTTLGDLYRVRFSPGVERLATILLVPTSVLWAAAQIRAFGQVIAVSSGFALEATIAFAACVVVVYTIFGGLLADAWTDVIQGVALIVGLGVLGVAVFAADGWTALAALDPARLSPFGGPDRSFLDTLEAWAIPVCGSGLAAELVARVIATRTPTIARRATLVAAAVYLVVGLIPVALGLAGPALVPGLEHPEQVLPQLAARYLSPLLAAIFAGALVSAILSTVDSALLVAASLVSHNLVVPLAPRLSDAGRVRTARAFVAAFGVLAWVLALHAEGVYALVAEASAFGSAGIFVCGVLGLFTRIGRSASAHASLAAGAVVWLVGAYAADLDHPYLVSLGAALASYLALAGVGSRSASPGQ